MTAATLKCHVRDGVKAFAKEAKGIREVVAPPKERCERIRYDGDFHIDIPGYHLDPACDARMLATENKGWERSDPKALVVWFREKAGNDDDRTQLRRVVRYLKMWAALRFDLKDRPSSILLTVLATEAYRLIFNNLYDDDDVLEAVVEKIADRLDQNRTVPNPVNLDEDLNRLDAVQTNSFINKLKALHEIAKRGLAAPTKLEASVIWTEAYEHFFPLPDEEEVLEESATNKSRALVPIRPLEIGVTATPRNGNGRIYQGNNEIGPIPKNYQIQFRVLSNIPLMADVEWMVRNGGTEAGQVNDLGHRASTGRDAEERSVYNGTHYMDCFAKQGGRVIGYRRVPVQINDGVARNRPKPTYVQFRSRRR